MRFNSDGAIDTSFGTNGVVITDIINNNGGTRNNFLEDIVVQPDGKIVGLGGGFGAGMVRYNNDGSLDQSFGTGGKVQTFGSALALQADGKIVVCGSFVSNYFQQQDFDEPWRISRYNADGTTDNSFGNNGSITTLFFADREAIVRDALVQPDGKSSSRVPPSQPTRVALKFVRWLATTRTARLIPASMATGC
jgi:uncharacterized delta-60 repeat protein